MLFYLNLHHIIRSDRGSAHVFNLDLSGVCIYFTFICIISFVPIEVLP